MASSWLYWLVALAICVGATIGGVSTGRPDVLMLVMSVISVGVVGWIIAENWQLYKANTPMPMIAAATGRHMGFVWSLGALGLLITYTTFLEWKEWLVFTGAFSAVAIMSLAFSVMVTSRPRETGDAVAEAAPGDDAMLKLGNYLAIVQLVGMIVAMIGLVLDGKMPASTDANPGWYDWAGNVLFFYGALMLAAISANALYTKKTLS